MFWGHERKSGRSGFVQEIGFPQTCRRDDEPSLRETFFPRGDQGHPETTVKDKYIRFHSV